MKNIFQALCQAGVMEDEASVKFLEYFGKEWTNCTVQNSKIIVTFSFENKLP